MYTIYFILFSRSKYSLYVESTTTFSFYLNFLIFLANKIQENLIQDELQKEIENINGNDDEEEEDEIGEGL